MGVRTEPLETYLIQAWREMQGDNTEMQAPPTISAHKSTANKPVLRSDQTNHILTYAGAFNPPHRGHMEMLADGFHNSGPGLNIVAALVAPIGDDGLRAKEIARKRPTPPQGQITFTQSQRVGLLTSHLNSTEELEELASKTRVWNLSSLDLYAGYMRRVMELAAADGFDVEFLSLKGSDHLWVDRPIKHPGLLDCRKIIFSEVLRANESAWNDGRPVPLKGGWGSWSNIGCVTGSDGVTSRSVWQCTLPSLAGSAVRLLTDDNEAGAPETSSTAIRKIISHRPQDMEQHTLIRELREAGAISPEMLAKIVMGNNDGQ